MRFLLATEGRSGTHMLRGVFRSHPDIVTFADHNNAIQGTPGAMPKYFAAAYGDLPATAIAGAFTHCGGLGKRGPQEPNGWLEEDWRTLRSMHDYVITLTRPNKLRQFVSKRLLQRRQDQDWASERPREESPAPLRLDCDDYRRDAENARSTAAEVSQLLAPHYPITYDQLVTGWEHTLRGIYAYLGLTWNNPRVATFKQENRPIQEMIDWDHLPGEQRQFLLAEDQRGL